ncbi:DUF4233 domain-containing protein [Jiangella gansuensis]|uniref:DUF4233 domain-containing protein n=1 Tax=Jiangella gansuensis TaxID=281473 RepID=UPI00047C422C|nr:DUF4233 domain-containing protein [Jiangella gansuensis]
MNRIAATILSVEAFVVILAVPVAINISDVSTGTAWLAGIGVALLCIAGAGMVRRGRPGYVVGSAAQVAALATGIVVPAMLVLGGIFALMWFVLLRIGPEVERAKAEREAAAGDSGDA